MLSVIATELKRNFGANLSIDRVRTESWIFEKVMKFAQQFSRPGKSLENGEKVWKNGYRSWVFFSKLQQVLEKWNFFCFVHMLFIQIYPYVFSVWSPNFSLEKEIIVLEKSLEEDLNFGSKNLYESCIDFCATNIRVTVEFVNLSYYWQ